MEVKGAEVEEGARSRLVSEDTRWEGCYYTGSVAQNGVGLQEGSGFHLKSMLAQQTDLHTAEDQQAALHQMIVLFFREMREDRNSLMY